MNIEILGDEFDKPLVRYSDKKYFKSLPRPIVLVNGSFDLLHSGHMYLLHLANRLSENGSVIVAVDSDKMIKRKKSKDRPLFSFLERYKAICFQPVTAIIEINSDQNFKTMARHLKPDYRVRGIEYKDYNHRVPGIDTLWVPRLGSISTTEIINRIKHGKI